MRTDAVLSSRALAPATDLPLLARFISDTTMRCPAYAFGHPGNLWWSMFYSVAVDPVRGARLWEDAAGSLLGLAWLDGAELVLHVHPDHRGTGHVEAPMLAWAEARVRQDSASAPAELSVFVSAADAAYHSLLERHGYRRSDDAYVLLERDLAAPLAADHAEQGFTVRPVAHPHEDAARVDVHRDAFAPSSFSIAAYERLQRAPGYVAGLDLVAAFDDGTLGAFALCWWDPGSRRGLFEPLGTRAALQRRGLGRAVLAEGLRRLRALGARSAAVGTSAEHREAIGLYEAVGLREMQRSFAYIKRVLAPTQP